MRLHQPELVETAVLPVGEHSAAGRRRILSRPYEPLFIADWMRVLFLHYEVDPTALGRAMPFEVDLREGRAYVSLVAFTMENMRPRFGGRLGRLLCRAIATHRFLNVRAYVRHGNERGIHFLAEWLDNPLSVSLGPRVFGLPYRPGWIDWRHEHERGVVEGEMESCKGNGRLRYEARLPAGATFMPCDAGTLDEFLLERYTAFTSRGKRRRFFRVWHAPWVQCRARIRVGGDSILTENWPWMEDALLVGANYSPGATGVWMGWPHRLN